MDRELIETLSKIAQRLGTKGINIPKFYGYEREDIDQWLDEFDYHLQQREISPTSKTALTQLNIHIAGPAGTGNLRGRKHSLEALLFSAKS